MPTLLAIIVFPANVTLIGAGAALLRYRRNLPAQRNVALLTAPMIVCLGFLEGATRLLDFTPDFLHLFRENPAGTGS